MDANMMTKGTEIYMKCLFALQQQNSPDVSTMTAATATMTMNSPYFYQQPPLFYQSNQLLPQSQTVPYFPSTPNFEPTNGWPSQHHHQQYVSQPYDHPHSSELFLHTKPMQNIMENEYFHNGFDQNGMQYGSQVSIAGTSAVPTPLSSSTSGECSVQNWPVSSQPGNIYQLDRAPVPVTYSQNADCSINTNHLKSSIANGQNGLNVSIHNEKPSESKNRPMEIHKKEKKIPRPMNSFMIYAKLHRALVHELYPLCDNRTVSKILSDTWYSMDAEKKREYHGLAAEMRQEHCRLYPEFKWKTAQNKTTASQRKKLLPIVESNAQQPSSEQQTNDGNDDTNGTLSVFQLDELGDLVSPYSPITPSPEKSMSSDSGCGDKLKPTNESQMSQTVFQLAPTPAQLGKKKRTKSNASATSSDSSNGNHNDRPKEGSDNFALVSNHPHFKQRILDLPKFDFSNYRESSDWDSSPMSPAITYNTNMRKRKCTQPSATDEPVKRLIGKHFFGPDFDINHFKNVDSSPSSTAATPDSADSVKMTKGKERNNKKRHLLNHRQFLIMKLFEKCGLFPSTQEIDNFLKEHMQMFNSTGYLNVKIREFRQKYMQNKSP